MRVYLLSGLGRLLNMQKACAAAVLVAFALSGCGGSTGKAEKATAICKDMIDELTSLATVSAAIQAQKYATPADAVSAIAAVQKRIAGTNGDAATSKVNDLAVSFGAMLIAVQDFQTNVATQDAAKEAQVQTELQQGDSGVRAACAKH